MTVRERQRLRASTLARADADIAPEYDRSATPCIAHVGLGAFARAHLAVYADELLRLGQPALIRGVSIRSRRAQDQLEPQDGLFTLAIREPGEEMSLQVVGALTSVQTGAAAALDALTAPATKLVTLTITEKGYEATADMPVSDVPTSVPALVALSLAQRRQAGVAPPVFASLDNLLDNGSVLRARVLDAAERIDPSLAPWIARNVLFPSSVVDRMVPAPTERDLEEVADRLGLIDRAAVSAERHRSWIIRSVDGLGPLAGVGVELVQDVAPFERRKLWLLNGPHSATAYGGLLAGHETIAAAVTDPVIARFVRRLVDDTLEVAELPAGLQAATFAGEALRRFANPALGHTCAQVGADGSSKLPQRLLPVVAARQERALDTEGFAVVVAIWIAATAGVAVRGVDLPQLEDPIAGALRATSRRDGVQGLSHAALGSLADGAFRAQVASALQRLTADGPAILEAER
jgi:fructuronate reductase